jgi:fatty-acyl-CoA synthase
MAWIKLKPGVTATEQEVLDYCRYKMAYFKIPFHIRFTDTFPMTVTGEIQKFRMKEISTKELGLEDAATIKTA